MNRSWYPAVKEGYDFDAIMETLPEWNSDYQDVGLVAFKGADLTNAQLVEVFKAVGERNRFGHSGSPDHTSKELPDFSAVEGHGDWSEGAQLYYDTHHNTMGANVHTGHSPVDATTPVAIQFHLENNHRVWPQVAAGWTVPFKTCPPQEGRTGFLDCQTIFKQFPTAIQETLLTLPTIIEYPSAEEAVLEEDSNDLLPSTAFTALMRESCTELGDWAFDGNGYTCEVRPAALPHPVTGIPVLRTMPFSVRQGALREEDEAEWAEARVWIRRAFDMESHTHVEGGVETTHVGHHNCVVCEWGRDHRRDIEENFGNLQNLVWWEWDTTDFLMVDLFRMAHGVSAFPGGTRTLRGIFGYDLDVDWDNFSTSAPSIASPNEDYPLPEKGKGAVFENNDPGPAPTGNLAFEYGS
jgi:hypothetical protein